jgi:hypothetical protein
VLSTTVPAGVPLLIVTSKPTVNVVFGDKTAVAVAGRVAAALAPALTYVKVLTPVTVMTKVPLKAAVPLAIVTRMPVV